MTHDRPEPTVVRYAKWATAIALAFTTVGSLFALVIVLTVRWAAGPIVREESRASQARDSLIVSQMVSRFEALNRKTDLLGDALRYPLNSAERDDRLDAAIGVRPRPLPVELPENVKFPEKKRPRQ